MPVATDMPFSLPDSKSRQDPQEEILLFGELLSVTTHDLRSPLGAIGIFCELLLMGDKPLDESQERSVQMIAEAAGKAQRILEDASEVSRIYRGMLTLAKEAVDLRNLIGEVASQARLAAEARGVTLTVNFAPGDYIILADSARLFPAVLRLVEEAVALSPRDREVNISGAVSDFGEIAVTVAMNGSDQPGERARREPEASLKGRLANRKPGESRYSLYLASRVTGLMGGALEYTESGPFHAVLRFPVARS